MSRDFLFRAWHPTEAKMVYFDFGDINHGMVLNAAFEGRYCDLAVCQIMQYTGLSDRNGREIYEGDILQFDVNEWGGARDSRFVVGWQTESATFVGNGTVPDWSEWCAVIGNVWENADLMGDAAPKEQ